MIGEEGQAFYYATSGLETARAHTAARAIGLAQGALDDSIAYAGERMQFGRPIADFQAIRFKIAEMATQIEAARQLIYFVCEQIDTGQRCDKEASMVKLFASEMAERVCSEGSRSTAARATPPCTPSSATGATRGSPRSSRAPRRSRSASSPTACSAAGGTDEGLRPHRQAQLLRGLQGRRRAEARPRQDRRAARAGLDHQRHHEHRRGPLQRAPDEVEPVRPAAGLRRRHHLDVHRPCRPGHRRERADGARAWTRSG